MTQERDATFDKFALEHGYFDCGHFDYEKNRYAGSDLRAAFHGWQASREQLKAKLLSDEVVERVIKVISENLTPQDCSLMAVRACLERAAKASLKAVVGEI